MRNNLSVDVADIIARRIVEGGLPLDSHLNEFDLARELGVSRTPLREALARLAAEGLVVAVPRHGFRVQALTDAELRDLYGMRAVLDPAALGLAGIPSASALRELGALNRRIAAADGDIELVIDLDDQWHLALVDACPNRILLDLIHQYMRRTRPLERAYMRSEANVRRMTREHDRILAFLRRGDLTEAVNALQSNMQSGLEPLLAWRAAQTDDSALERRR